jgi:hypothetical protein
MAIAKNNVFDKIIFYEISLFEGPKRGWMYVTLSISNIILFA